MKGLVLLAEIRTRKDKEKAPEFSPYLFSKLIFVSFTHLLLTSVETVMLRLLLVIMYFAVWSINNSNLVIQLKY